MRGMRSWWCSGLLACGLLTSGHAAAESDWVRGIYVGLTPRAVSAHLADAWKAATRLAELTDRAFVLVGSGRSMRPLYSPGTILVLQKISYSRLQRGQTVLYRNPEGRTVAHVLVTRTRSGWRAQIRDSFVP